jgi:uncharacterized protein (TIGR00369 family)
VTDDDAAKLQRRRERFLRGFSDAVPHNKAIGIEFVEVGDRMVKLKLPYREDLVGNIETGVLHGGAITALLDACCGSAVFTSLVEPQPIATLDLRIDYLGQAAPGRDVIARADCYKMTRNVGFVRAIAYHDDEAAPIASAAGTFMIATRATRSS